MADWIAAHTLDEVLAAFEAVSAPIAPAYDTAQISEDPHYLARESFVTRPDPDLGEITMPGIVPRLSRTPGRIRFNGPTEVGAIGGGAGGAGAPATGGGVLASTAAITG